MFRHLKTLKKLLILLPAVLVLSCQSKAPKMDPIDVYVKAPDKVWKCANSQTGKCPELTDDQTVGMTGFKPAGIKTILDYIATLKCLLDGGCGAETKYVGNVEMIRVHKPDGAITKWTRVQDIEEAHRQMSATLKNLNRQVRAAQPQ